jgi:hypothetical protein
MASFKASLVAFILPWGSFRIPFITSSLPIAFVTFAWLGFITFLIFFNVKAFS